MKYIVQYVSPLMISKSGVGVSQCSFLQDMCEWWKWIL